MNQLVINKIISYLPSDKIINLYSANKFYQKIITEHMKNDLLKNPFFCYTLLNNHYYVSKNYFYKSRIYRDVKLCDNCNHIVKKNHIVECVCDEFHCMKCMEFCRLNI